MAVEIFGKSVQGSSHKRTDPPTPCQDSCSQDGGYVLPDGTIIIAVADGHGSKECKYSHLGSRYAIDTFISVMNYYHEKYGSPLDYLFSFLKEEGKVNVAQDIDNIWKKRVFNKHGKSKRYTPEADDLDEKKAKIYKLYGSTLVGLMITPSFLFAYQLGDGDIIYIDSDSVSKEVVMGEKFLGTDTHSLSSKDSWKQAVTYVRRWDDKATLPHMFMLSTDGFANSYKNEQEFHKTCVDYFEMIKEHGSETIKSNLQKWLEETSEHGCGDDITVLMAYFNENQENKPAVSSLIESDSIPEEESEVASSE